MHIIQWKPLIIFRKDIEIHDNGAKDRCYCKRTETTNEKGMKGCRRTEESSAPSATKSTMVEAQRAVTDNETQMKRMPKLANGPKSLPPYRHRTDTPNEEDTQ